MTTTEKPAATFKFDAGEIFFEAANQHLRLGRCERINRTYNPIYGNEDEKKSPYCCDAIGAALEAVIFRAGVETDPVIEYGSTLKMKAFDQLEALMHEAGMPDIVWRVFDSVPEDQRQEARYLFLCTLAEVYKRKTITAKAYKK